MSEISPSVWQQNKAGEWKLYFNTGQEQPPHAYASHKKEQKNKNKNISEKNLMLGTLMMTPKGIGRLIKNDNGIAYIRFNQNVQEYQFHLL